MKVKTFKANDLPSLEMLINNWLHEMMPERPQMQYDSGWSVDNVPEYTVIILYDNHVPFGGKEVKAAWRNVEV